MRKILLLLMIMAITLPGCEPGMAGNDDTDETITGTEGLPPEMPVADGPASVPSDDETALLDSIVLYSLQYAFAESGFPAILDAMTEASKVNPPLPGEAAETDGFRYGPAMISGAFILEEDGDVPYVDIDFRIEDGYLMTGSIASSSRGTVYDIYISGYEPDDPQGIDLIESSRIYINMDSDSFIASFSAKVMGLPLPFL